MHQPSESRKSPSAKCNLSISTGRKSPGLEAALSLTLAQDGSAEKDQQTILGCDPRDKTKEQNIFWMSSSRAQELGPLTTMDSREFDINQRYNHTDEYVTATIPGRPPVYERSSSAPNLLSIMSGPALDKNAETARSDSNSTAIASQTCYQNPKPIQGSKLQKLQVSRKPLAPLVTHSRSGPQISPKQSSTTTLRSVAPDLPPNVSPKLLRSAARDISPDVPPKSPR